MVTVHAGKRGGVISRYASHALLGPLVLNVTMERRGLPFMAYTTARKIVMMPVEDFNLAYEISRRQLMHAR